MMLKNWIGLLVKQLKRNLCSEIVVRSKTKKNKRSRASSNHIPHPLPNDMMKLANQIDIMT